MVSPADADNPEEAPILHLNPRSRDRSSPASAGRGILPDPATQGGRPSLAQVLWRRKKLVAVLLGISLVVAMVYLVIEPNHYQSMARLTVTAAGPRPNTEASDRLQLSNFLNTQGEKITSSEVLAFALNEVVPPDAELPGMTGKKTRELQTFKESEFTPLTTLRTFTDVSIGKQNDALVVTFESPFKDEAPAIANAIVRGYIKYQTEPKHSNVQSALDRFMADKQKIDAELKTITEQLSELEQRYGVLTNNGQDNLAYRQLAVIAQLHAASHAERLRAQSDAEEAERMSARDPRLIVSGRAAPPAIVSADDEQMLRTNLTHLQSQLQDMRSRYLPNHPAVAALQQKLEQAADAHAQAVRRRFVRAQAAENDLAEQLAQQQKRANDAGAQAAHYAALREEAERKHHMLDKLDTKVHDVELQQTAGLTVIDFFDKADLPRVRKSSPSIPRTLTLAAILGLVLGCGAAFWRDRSDDRLHTTEQIKAALQVPLLGAVPRSVGGIVLDSSGHRLVLERTSNVAEAFRSIQTAINSTAPKDRCKTLLITSPSPGDGKSTVAANLGAMMAQTGKKVLLIDANLREPSLNSLFDLADVRIGLSNLLNGQAAWEQTIHRTSVDGLDLLPTGPTPRNSSEMLNSPMFSELLEMLAEKYDHVLIDSPAVMGLADARIMSASCDLTLLILRAEKSARKSATAARDALLGVGAHVLGAIINDISPANESAYDVAYRFHHPHADPAPTVVQDNAISSDAAGELLSHRNLDVRKKTRKI